MDERPILFTSEMVRAILDGRKTQTRRIVKLTDSGRIKKLGSPKNWHPDDTNAVQACPYGVAGEYRLWVRETWRKNAVLHRYEYKADGWALDKSLPWTPSIHMPKMYCRLWLEITEVRVERLQAISEVDAIAEGVVRSLHFGKSGIHRTAQDAYQALWESINGAGSWALNPYVWVLTFRQANPLQQGRGKGGKG